MHCILNELVLVCDLIDSAAELSDVESLLLKKISLF